MKILICSDGTSSAQSAIDLGGLFAAPLRAETTLLGIAEKSGDEQPLREALHTQAQSLTQRGVSPHIVVQFGEPVLQIVDQTSHSKYDLVVIGARWTGAVGHYWRSKRTYEVIKAIQPPVLVAIGECKELKRYAGLRQRLRLRTKRFPQGLLVFRFFCDSQKRGLGSERGGKQCAEIDRALS